MVPCAGRPAMSLSLMRRDPETPNGLMEFMIARGIGALKDLGVEEISLNFVAFGRILRAPETLLQRILRRALRRADRWFQITSLQQFNAKFFPRWTPRYMMVESWLSTPRAGLAIMELEGQTPQFGHNRPAARPADARAGDPATDAA